MLRIFNFLFLFCMSAYADQELDSLRALGHQNTSRQISEEILRNINDENAFEARVFLSEGVEDVKSSVSFTGRTVDTGLAKEYMLTTNRAFLEDNTMVDGFVRDMREQTNAQNSLNIPPFSERPPTPPQSPIEYQEKYLNELSEQTSPIVKHLKNPDGSLNSENYSKIKRAFDKIGNHEVSSYLETLVKTLNQTQSQKPKIFLKPLILELKFHPEIYTALSENRSQINKSLKDTGIEGIAESFDGLNQKVVQNQQVTKEIKNLRDDYDKLLGSFKEKEVDYKNRKLQYEQNYRKINPTIIKSQKIYETFQEQKDQEFFTKNKLNQLTIQDIHHLNISEDEFQLISNRGLNPDLRGDDQKILDLLNNERSKKKRFIQKVAKASNQAADSVRFNKALIIPHKETANLVTVATSGIDGKNATDRFKGSIDSKFKALFPHNGKGLDPKLTMSTSEKAIIIKKLEENFPSIAHNHKSLSEFLEKNQTINSIQLKNFLKDSIPKQSHVARELFVTEIIKTVDPKPGKSAHDQKRLAQRADSFKTSLNVIDPPLVNRLNQKGILKRCGR